MDSRLLPTLALVCCAPLLAVGCGSAGGGSRPESSTAQQDSGPGDDAAGDGGACPATCAFGCDPGTGDCSDMVPANQAAVHLATGDYFTCTPGGRHSGPDVNVPAGGKVTFDTGAQTIEIEGSGQVSARWGDPYSPDGTETSATVVHLGTLTLGSGANLAVTTSSWPVAELALIILVDQNVTAAGGAAAVVDVSAMSTQSGVAQVDAGGAGEVLQFGASGAGEPAGFLGGPGGGALQISACGSIDIGTGVVLDASGGGGGGGPGGEQTGFGGLPGDGSPGGGGGSGGTILLEASRVTVLGAIAANGGGGGGGGGVGAPGADGSSGQTWDVTASPSTAAVGGLGAAGGGGNGGAGGAANSPSGQPGVPAGPGNSAGGAGGSVGAVFVNVPLGAAAPTIGSASPAPTVSHVCTTATSNCSYPPG